MQEVNSDLDDSERFVLRIGVNFGEVLAEGTPEDIRRNADVQAAYLGTG